MLEAAPEHNHWAQWYLHLLDTPPTSHVLGQTPGARSDGVTHLSKIRQRPLLIWYICPLYARQTISCTSWCP